MQAPTVKSQKIYVVLEQVLESSADPRELHEYLRSNKFTGNAELVYDAHFNQGGVRRIVVKEHIPMTMEELDSVLTAREGVK